MVSQNFINVSTLTIATNDYRLIIGIFVLIGIAIAIIGCCFCYYCYKKNGCNYNSSYGARNRPALVSIGTGGVSFGGSGPSCRWTSQTFAVNVIITYNMHIASYIATVVITAYV